MLHWPLAAGACPSVLGLAFFTILLMTSSSCSFLLLQRPFLLLSGFRRGTLLAILGSMGPVPPPWPRESAHVLWFRDLADAGGPLELCASPMLLVRSLVSCLVRLASWSSRLWTVLLLILRRMASLGGYLTSTGLAWDVIRTLLLSLLGLLTTLVLIAFL